MTRDLAAQASTTVNRPSAKDGTRILRGMDKSRQIAKSRHTEVPAHGKRTGDDRVQVLLPFAARWCADLPIDARPELLLELFPAIANKLALAWPEPAKARELLDELLIDRRGDRSGFPSTVVGELFRLHGLISNTTLGESPPEFRF